MKFIPERRFKALISLITVVALILGTVSISFMTSLAASQVNHSSIEYTIPKFKTNSDSTGNTKEKLETYTGWWSPTYLNSEGTKNIADNGGVIITYENAAATNVAIPLNKTFNINHGLSVKLEAVGPSNNTNRLFYGINLSTTSGANTSPLLNIQVDGFNGRVSYRGYNNIGVDETFIIENNKLKSLADKTVYIDLVKRSDSGFDLVMDIEGDVISSTAPIPASAFTAAGITDTVYVGLAGMSNTRTPTTITWLGVGTVPEPTIHDQTDYGTLTLDDFNKSDSDLTYWTTTREFFTAKPSNINGGGIKLPFSTASHGGVALKYDNKVSVDRLSVKLQYVQGADTKPFFAINLTENSDAGYSIWAADTGMNLYVDGKKNQVFFRTQQTTVNNVIIGNTEAEKNIVAKIANGGIFYFDFALKDDGSIVVTLTVGQSDVSGEISANLVNELNFADKANTNFGIAGVANGITGATATEINLLGIGYLPEPAIHDQTNYTVPQFKTATFYDGETVVPLATYSSYWPDKYLWADTASETDGIKLVTTKDANGYMPIPVNKQFNLDGLSYKLMVKSNATNKNQLFFSINFGLTAANLAPNADNMLSIYFDGNAGDIGFVKCKNSTLAENGKLITGNATIKAMADKQLYIDIVKKSDNSGLYQVIAYIGNETVKADIPEGAITADMISSGKVYAAIAGRGCNGDIKTTIKWQGIGNLPKAIVYNTIALNDSKLDYIGRVYYNSADKVLSLDMSNTGIAFKTKATEVKVKLRTEAPSDGATWQKCFVKVFVDGAETKHFEVTAGENEYELATGLDIEKETEIKLLKVTEPIFSFLDITELKVAGELCEITNKPIKIEAIGDSITSGYGALSTPVATDPDGSNFVSSEEDSNSTYAAYLAQKYGYELSAISSSGGGVYGDSSGKLAGESGANILPDMYDYYIAPNARRVLNDYSSVSYNHGEHPDIIVINLGTNDNSAMNKSADKDAFKTGFLNAAETFVRKLHTLHPNAKIVWAYGLMNNGLTETLKKLEDNLADEMDFTFIDLPNQKVFSDTCGADNHPHKETQKLTADYIYNELNGVKNSHTDRAYIVPVLTTEDVEGNTVLDQATCVNWWGSWYNEPPSNLQGNTGIHLSYKQGVTGMRMSIDKKFYLNTLSLKMGNIGTSGDKETVHFSVVISKDRTAEYTGSNGAMKITINGGNGNAKVLVNGQTVGTILDDNAAVLATMAGKEEIYIDFNKANDNTGDYLITVFSGAQSLTDRITAEMLENVNFDPEGQVYVGLTADSPSGAQKATSYDFLGICDIIATKKATELIATIGTVNLADGSPIKKARAAYDALEKSEKETISNYQLLLDAEKEYDRLADEADRDLIPASIHTAHFVNYIDASNVQGTLNAWKKYMQISDVKTGGQRFNFSGASTGMREGFSHRLSIDGLYLQFDNFVRSTDASGKFALIFGGEEFYIGDWKETAAKKSFGLLFDTLNGTVSTLGSGITTIITNDGLKYSALEQKRFSIEIKEKDFVYTVTVRVGGNTYSGNFSSEIFKETLSLKDPNNCRFVISAWGSSQYYSIDLIGVGKDTAVDNAKALIDDIGIVNNGSKVAIDKAVAAYEALSSNEKLRVTNYTSLEHAVNYYEKTAVKYNVGYVIDKIDEVGEATLENGDEINAAYSAYCNLSDEDKKKVTNVDALFKALDDFYKTVNKYADYEKFVYAALNSSEPYDVEWGDCVTYKVNEDNTMHIDWKDARRDMIQGTRKKFDLDGLRIELANITPAKGQKGVKFAIQFNKTNWPVFNTGATSVALVVDTNLGEIRAFPGNHLIIKSDTLKQESINNASVQFSIHRGSDYVYRLRTITPAGTVEAAIPTSAIEFLYSGTTKGTYFAIGPWTDCTDGLRDNTTHSFSLDVVSAYSELSTKNYVFSQVVGMEQELEALSSNVDDHTLATIQEIVNKYRKLNNNFKALIKNYGKVTKILNALYEAESLEKYGTELEGDKADSNTNTGDSPFTGSVAPKSVTVLIAAVALAGVFLLGFSIKGSGRKGKKYE